jgi:hypothetical protein
MCTFGKYIFAVDLASTFTITARVHPEVYTHAAHAKKLLYTVSIEINFKSQSSAIQ